jgi:hypothetical protein
MDKPAATMAVMAIAVGKLIILMENIIIRYHRMAKSFRRTTWILLYSIVTNPATHLLYPDLLSRPYPSQKLGDEPKEKATLTRRAARLAW